MTVFCLLSNEPIPAPQFELTVVANNVSYSHSEILILVGNSSLEVSLNSSILYQIFEKSSDINITCRVSNTEGSISKTTLIRACGR